MKPGVHHNLSNADYHGCVEALGSSGLKKLARSPLHFYASTLDPERPVSEPTPAMRAGTLAHCAVLEPDELEKRYVVRPAGLDGRTREGKEWLAAISLDREVISADQLQTAQRQAASIRALPEVGQLLSRGEAEVSAFAIDPATGIMLKARPDWVAPAGDNACVILDVKTCKDASPADFAKSVVHWGYALQAVHYSDVYEQASGIAVLGFAFLCTESDFPHASAAYMIPDEWLDMARRKRRRLLELYARCRESGTWPGYSQTLDVLPMPRWLTEDAS